VRALLNGLLVAASVMAAALLMAAVFDGLGRLDPHPAHDFSTTWKLYWSGMGLIALLGGAIAAHEAGQ